MDFTQTEQASQKKLVGIAVVVLLHVLVVYALLTGLARKVVEVIKQPIETKLIEEIKPPPPPPEKPVAPPPPKLAAPPPPFIPPPEIQVQQPPQQQNAIAAVTSVKPENPVLPPVAPPVPAPVVNAVPVRVPPVIDSRNCEKPKYPRASELAEETGVVVLALLVDVDGRVVDSKIDKSSGFTNLDKAARNALSLCRFKPATADGKPEQAWAKITYEWKLN